MSVLIKGMNVTWNRCTEDCPFCYDYMYCVADTKERPVSQNGIPSWCPLVKVTPHGDLIDKEVIYNRTAEWEAQALAHLDELSRTPRDEMEKEEYIAWRVWSAILTERSAFKHDVFDAPIVIEAEGEEDD